MAKCYIKDVPIKDGNKSNEHIIPSALGGHLKSDNLVSKEINNNLFAKLDAVLVNHIELSKIIEFKRDRGEQPSIVGETNTGDKFKINAKEDLVEMMPFKPQVKLDKNGNEQVVINALYNKEYFKALQRKNPSFTIDQLKEKYNYREEYTANNYTLYFEHGLSFIGELEPFRCIAKIATNFAVYNKVKRENFKDYIAYIEGDLDIKSVRLGYFYPTNRLKYNFGEKEISNILYIKGCSKEKILYCYTELFNVHCFIVTLSYDYNGEDFSKSHIWDLKQGVIIDKPIELNVNRYFLNNLKHPHCEGLRENYSQRLDRLAKIENLNIIKRE
jgi:hypothetical protein